MIKKPTTGIVVSKEDKQAYEDKRISKLIRQYKVGAEKAQAKGISSRFNQIGTVKKNSLKKLMPDAGDKKNIERLIETYNIAFPYPHEESLQMAMEEGLKGTIRDPKKLKNRDDKLADRPALSLHLPIPFTRALKMGYPIIFSYKPWFEWFITNFPQFNLNINQTNIGGQGEGSANNRPSNDSKGHKTRG